MSEHGDRQVEEKADRTLNLALAAIGIVAGVFAVCWTAALILAVIHHGPVPTFTLERLFDLPGGPSAVFATTAPTVPWTILVVVLLTGLAVPAWWIARTVRANRRAREHDPHYKKGLATRREAQQALGEKKLLAQATTIRPSVRGREAVLRPADIGYWLGASFGARVWVSCEQAVFLIAPPRGGKTAAIVAPWIVEAPGAVVSTSTRAENAVMTMGLREAAGHPVAVFDVGAEAPGLSHRVRWDITSGCEDPQVAQVRVAALTENAASGVENGDFWKTLAVNALEPMFHAAALSGRGSQGVYAWSVDYRRAKEAVKILQEHKGAARNWAERLEGVLGLDPKTRDSAWATVSQALTPLAQPAVLDACSPEPGQGFDVEDFLTRAGTLYVIGGDEGAAATVVACLIEEVFRVAKHRANRMPGNRLDPPLLNAFDELANIAKLPSIGTMMSAGGGAGITTLAVFQSKAQARARWSKDEADAIWGAANVKIILPGLGDEQDLNEIAALLGNREEATAQVSLGAGGTSRSWSSREVKVMDPGEITQMPKFTALALVAGSRGIYVDLAPYWKRPYGAKIAAAVKAYGQDLELDDALPLEALVNLADDPGAPETVRAAAAELGKQVRKHGEDHPRTRAARQAVLTAMDQAQAQAPSSAVADWLLANTTRAA